MEMQDEILFLKSHTSKKRIDKFMLTEDIYHDWVWFIVHEGAFAYVMGDTPGTAQKGELVVCPPGVRFARTVKDHLSFHFLHLDIGPRAGMQPGLICVDNQSRLFSDLEMLDLADGMFDDILPNLEYKTHIVKDIWYLYRMTVQQAGKTQDEFIIKILKQIRRCAFDKYALSALAAENGLSYSQFKKRFIQSQGKTPMEYITDLRMEKAKAMLEETALPLEKLANSCGYENQFYFSTMFKKKTGLPPSAYRDIHKA